MEENILEDFYDYVNVDNMSPVDAVIMLSQRYYLTIEEIEKIVGAE